MTQIYYDATALQAFAAALLTRAGLAAERATTVAEVLVEGDLFGHTTHGLQLLGPYLNSIQSGGMRTSGDIEVISDRGAAVLWDGHYLPGPWLVVQALNLAMTRAAQHGMAAVTIRRSHHIACLQAYLKRATDQGMIALLLSSDPSMGSVAPHGGLQPLFTPNPLAAGIPTDGAPILMDISTSTTTNGLTGRLYQSGERLPHPWVKDNAGNVSDDPAVLFTDPPGSILPVGGLDHGHKGFALAVLVEALTAALGGHGRADGVEHWGGSIFVQALDPAAFGGAPAFRRETGWLVNACHNSPVKPGDPPVRLPGEAGLARRERQLKEGVALFAGIMEGLQPYAEKYAVSTPLPL